MKAQAEKNGLLLSWLDYLAVLPERSNGNVNKYFVGQIFIRPHKEVLNFKVRIWLQKRGEQGIGMGPGLY